MSVACKECGTIYDNHKEVSECLEEHQSPPSVINVRGFWYKRMSLPRDKSQAFKNDMQECAMSLKKVTRELKDMRSKMARVGRSYLRERKS